MMARKKGPDHKPLMGTATHGEVEVMTQDCFVTTGSEKPAVTETTMNSVRPFI